MPVSKTSKKSNAKKPHGASWRSGSDKGPKVLQLPSGETCLVKSAMGLSGLIEAGIIDSMDTLTGTVTGKTIPKAAGRPIIADLDSQELLKDPKKFEAMMQTVDRVVIYAVLDPKVVSNMRPLLDDDGEPRLDENNKPAMQVIPDDEREDGVVYVDYIDEMDRIEIMSSAVGGTRGFQKFRGESTEAVGDVPAVEADADTTV